MSVAQNVQISFSVTPIYIIKENLTVHSITQAANKRQLASCTTCLFM